MDRNLGLVFALWDGLFGTLYVPKGYEKIEYGISKKEKNPFNSVRELYVLPFHWAWKTLRNNKVSRKRFIRLALFVVYIGAISEIIYASIKEYSPPSVNLEELTWTEVKQAQDHGYDSILIPTGGTEQNGPHMVLGKHNYIARYTAEKIARKAGKMLVAPVIAYVPEGAIEPVPTFHMPYPGTITLPDDVFEAMLKSAAESFIHHGFHYIFFVGEHYNSQNPQRAAAEKLAKKWAGRGVTVAQIDKYYSGNGQFDWLLAKGYTAGQIGGHAGIRDTSELLVVHPDGVRSFPVFATKGSLAYAPEGVQGYSGDFTKARKAIGEQLLDMKIEAALAEIRTIRKESAPEKPAVPTPKAISSR
jgi:creatinine amidohydrolase/Fe(II)-dependent formamide hydrolase-like protein